MPFSKEFMKNEKLDKEMFVQNIHKNFSDFEKYAQYIAEYIKGLNNTNS